MIEFSGVLTDKDVHRHIALPFDVPAGVKGISVQYDYEPRHVDMYTNLVTLSLYDPQGCRGNAHRGSNHETIQICETAASFGFTHGSIPDGVWQVVLHTHMVLPGDPVWYTVKITFESEAQGTAPSYASGVKPQRGAGWYRGNIHSHTFHSDGHWMAADLVAWARSEKLDFIALTDHNTISGLAEMDSLSTPDLLTMGGLELTTYFGHAVVLGTRRWVEWRTESNSGTMPPIQRQVEAEGHLFIIAHPKAPGGAICTGCAWEYLDMLPGSGKIVEIWNEEWESESNNEQALALWYGWLNAGHHLVATSGNDIHGAPRVPLNYGFNVIFAEELSEQALIAAIKRGHLYLSSGPQLDVNGRSASGETAMVGDTLAVDSITVRWSACSTDMTIRLIINGEVHEVLPTHAQGEHHWQLPDDWQWVVIEVRDGQGYMRAVTNPIYRQ